jgi:hypothetical protein
VVLLRVAQGCLVVAAVAGAVDHWTFPLGSYEETFESRGDTLPVQFLANVLMAVLLLVLAWVRRRAGNGEWAVHLTLAIGAATGSSWGPVLLWPALVWAFFGGWLWWAGRARSSAEMGTRVA